MRKTLRAELLASGATVVGFARLRGALGDEISHLETAVSIGVERTLNEETIRLLVSLQ